MRMTRNGRRLREKMQSDLVSRARILVSLSGLAQSEVDSSLHGLASSLGEPERICRSADLDTYGVPSGPCSLMRSGANLVHDCTRSSRCSGQASASN